jgi:phosphatidate cytidylyltransferase
MLKQRVITAVFMVLAVLAALFLAPPWLFALLAAAVLLAIGGWEAAALAGITQPRRRQWAGLIGLILAVAIMIWGGAGLTLIMLAAAAGAWLLAFLWLAQPSWGGHASPLKAGLLALILLGAWLAVVQLQMQSAWLIVWLLCVIGAADIGAYSTGRTIGGPKLAARISPGKTWSGAIGGMLAALLVAPLAAHLLPAPLTPLGVPMLALAGIGLAAVSIGGDLFISLLKRQAGLKDSSGLLPGHGGLLDRLDSLGAALPFFALLQMT